MPTTLTTPPVARLFGSDTAAAYLGISERMLDQLRLRRDFPQPIRLGRRILWDRKALDAFADRLAHSTRDPWEDVRAIG